MNLAAEIHAAAAGAVTRTAPRLRAAVVAATSPLTVTVVGDTAAVTATALASYTPTVGDTAQALLMPGAQPLLIGSTASDRAGCRLRRVATQAMPSGTPTGISWDTEDEDTHGFIAVTATTVTIPAGRGGRYDIVCWVNYQSVEATFHANRNYVDIGVTSAATGYPASFRTKIDSVEDQAVVSLAGIPLLAGDTFVARIFQDTGANQNLVAAWLTCYRTGA